jgi:hypothetical protein
MSRMMDDAEHGGHDQARKRIEESKLKLLNAVSQLEVLERRIDESRRNRAHDDDHEGTHH